MPTEGFLRRARVLDVQVFDSSGMSADFLAKWLLGLKW